MTEPSEGYKSGVQKVELGGTAADGTWSGSTQGGVISLGTYLTGEGYGVSTASVSAIGPSGDDALFVFTSTDYDDGDQVVGSGFTNASGYANDTWTISWVSNASAKLKDSDGNTVSYADVGSATDTGTFVFTHLSRGRFYTSQRLGKVYTVLDDISTASPTESAIFPFVGSLMSMECKVVHDTSGAVSATVSVYGTNETAIPTDYGSPLVTFSLSGTDEDRAHATVEASFLNYYAVISAIEDASQGVTLKVGV